MLKKTIGMAGFTLAEVLITLGIIGVVAAMTMPTLINSTQGAQYKTAYKKALSVLSQAVVMNIALEDYDLSQTVAPAATPNAKEHTAEAQSIYSLFKNRMNVVKVAENEDFDSDTEGDPKYYKIIHAGDPTSDVPQTNHFAEALGTKWISAAGDWPEATFLFMNDGITFIFDNSQESCAAKRSTDAADATDTYCIGYVDVNGQKGPNRIVQCDVNTLVVTAGEEDDAVCTVSTPTDIYPVMFYDQSVVPATAAGRAVLYAK